MTADVQRELAEALAGRWLSYADEDGADDLTEHPDRDGARITAKHAGLLTAALLPTVQRLIADAEKRAAAAALRDAADWLDEDPDKDGAPYIAGDGSVLFPHRLDIAEVVTWAAASLRDRAAALDPS